MNLPLLKAIIRAQKCDYPKSFGFHRGIDRYIEDQDLISEHIGEVSGFLLNPQLCEEYKVKGFKWEKK